MSVNQLQQRLQWLVMERQALRERGAAADILERNRLEIVRSQRRLTYALVELHPSPGEFDRAA
jgi:DNA-binding response OmpR family regulator